MNSRLASHRFAAPLDCHEMDRICPGERDPISMETWCEMDKKNYVPPGVVNPRQCYGLDTMITHIERALTDNIAPTDPISRSELTDEQLLTLAGTYVHGGGRLSLALSRRIQTTLERLEGERAAKRLLQLQKLAAAEEQKSDRKAAAARRNSRKGKAQREQHAHILAILTPYRHTVDDLDGLVDHITRTRDLSLSGLDLTEEEREQIVGEIEDALDLLY